MHKIVKMHTLHKMGLDECENDVKMMLGISQSPDHNLYEAMCSSITKKDQSWIIFWKIHQNSKSYFKQH